MEMVYEKVKLFRKQMEILIPEGFKDMPDYVAKKKYPNAIPRSKAGKSK